MARHNNHPVQLVHNDIPASLLPTVVCPALPCLALLMKKVTWQVRMQQPSLLICAKQLTNCATNNLFQLFKRLPNHYDECLRVNHKSCFGCVMPRPQKGDMAWHDMEEQPSVSICPHRCTNLATNNQFKQLYMLSKLLLWIMGKSHLFCLRKSFTLTLSTIY